MHNKNWYNFNFVKGPIAPNELANILSSNSQLLKVGAYSVFLGQVREDMIDNKTVDAIDYTANEEMAANIFFEIAATAKPLYNIEYIHILHSLETVKNGELCLLVLVSCGHRKESFKAIEYIVERLKKEVPVWGKEILSDKAHSWKVNK